MTVPRQTGKRAVAEATAQFVESQGRNDPYPWVPYGRRNWDQSTYEQALCDTQRQLAAYRKAMLETATEVMAKQAATESAERERLGREFAALGHKARLAGQGITSREVCDELGVPFGRLSVPDMRRAVAFMVDRVGSASYGSARSFA